MTETMGREELERLVDGVEYPISKRALLETMRQKADAAAILAVIEELTDEVYQSHAALMADLERALRSGANE